MTTTNGRPHLTAEQIAAKNGYPLPEHGHTCRNCGAPIECEWWAVIQARRLAASIHTQAQRLEAKMTGLQLGRRRNADFTVDEARVLLAELGSFNKVAARLGVSRQTVQRAVDPASLPPSVKERMR